MGKEQEWKLTVPEPALLEDILAWEEIRSRMLEAPREYHMQTSYFDTPDRRWSRQRITIRCRLENETPVVCVKAPLPGAAEHLRGEWELPGSDDVAAALPLLVEQGAPEELLGARGLVSMWEADFRRRAVLLGFADGSRCELALDLGALYGPTHYLPLCELELEMKAGDPAATLALLERLRVRYALTPQEKSKFARARALD